MKLYFYGNTLKNTTLISNGIISIMMPDLGVIYRSQFMGSQSDCEYTAAIMAVKFIENNKEFLSKQKIEILSDCSILINTVNEHLPADLKDKVYCDTIQMYLKKYKLTLAWVPRSENRAAQSVTKLPPLKLNLNLNFDFGQQGNDAALIQPGSNTKNLL